MQFIFTGTTVTDYKVTEGKCIIFTSRDSCAEQQKFQTNEPNRLHYCHFILLNSVSELSDRH